MRLLIVLVLFVLAACAVAGCVRHVDLRPIDAAIDAPIYPDSSIDAAGPDAAGVAPDAAPDAAIDAI